MLFAPSQDYRELNQQTIVTINGRPYRAVGLPERTIALNRQRSSCTITLEDEPPTFAAGSVVPAWVDIRMSGTSRRVYTGNLASKDIDSVMRTITLGDALWKLNRTPQEACATADALILSNETPQDALVKVLNAAGITNDELVLPFIIPEPNSPGANTVCPLAPHCIEVNENLQQVFDKLCEFLGVAAFCMPMAGKVAVLPYDTRPTENPSIVYDNDGGYAVIDLKKHADDPKDVVTVMTVKGAAPVVDGVEGAEPAAIWRVVDDAENPLDIAGRPDKLSNEFIQTQAAAWMVAEREGRLRCRVEQRHVLFCGMDTDLLPGMSVQVRHPLAHIPERTPMYVVGVRLQGTTMQVELSEGESKVAGFQDKQFLADFTVQVVAETIVLAGSPATIYDVSLDGSGSCGDGIASYTWTVTGTTPRYAPPDGMQSFAILDTLEGVTVTLTVSDGEQNTASITQALDAPGIKVLRRMLHAAVDGQWCVLPKNEWLRWTPPGTQVTAIARYNELGPLWCGCANGAIYKRAQDDLSAKPELVTTFDAAIADIAVGEPFNDAALINTIIVAHGTQASWTHDAGETWQSYDFADVTAAVQIDPYNRYHLFVCVGHRLMETYDGTVWREVIVNPDNQAVAEDFGNAPWDTCVIFSATTGQQQILFASDTGWTGDALSGVPQTVTPGVDSETFRVFTDDGSIFLLTQSDTDYLCTSIGQTDPSGNTHRAVRDGKYPAVYFADTQYLGKQLNDDAAQIYPLLAGNASRVGYAGLGTPIVQKTVQAGIAWARTGNDKGIWICRDGVWSNKTSANGLPSGHTYWHSLSVDTSDPKKMLVCGTAGWDGSAHWVRMNGSYIDRGRDGYDPDKSPFYLSPDGGETWYELRIMDPRPYSHGHMPLGAGQHFLHNGLVYMVYTCDPVYGWHAGNTVVYAGHPQWVTDHYEIATDHIYGDGGSIATTNSFDVGATNDFNAATIFCKGKLDENGYPEIPWLARYYRIAGYISYDPVTDTVSWNKRDYSGDVSNTWSKVLSVIPGTRNLLVTAFDYHQYQFQDYRSSDAENFSPHRVASSYHIPKHVGGMNGKCYAVTGHTGDTVDPYILHTHPIRINTAPYKGEEGTFENRTVKKNYFCAASSQQDGYVGRYIAFGAIHAEGEKNGISLLDLETGTEDDDSCPLEEDMKDMSRWTYMSSTAFEVFAEERL